MEILLNDLKTAGYKVSTAFPSGSHVYVYDLKLARYVAENVTVLSNKIQLPTTYNAYDAWLTIEGPQGVEEVQIARPYADIAEIMTKYDVDKPTALQLERVSRGLIDSYTRGFKYWIGLEELVGQGGDILPIAVRISFIQRMWENAKIVYDVDSASNEVVVRPSRNGYGIIADIAEAPWEGTRTEYNIRQFADTLAEDGYFQFYYDYYVEGIFGWGFIPQAVKDAAMILIADLQCGNIPFNGQYVTSYRNANGSVSFDKQAFYGTGNRFADSLLEPYCEKIGRMAII